MAGERTLPGLGLTGFWTQGSAGWKPGMDTNLLQLSALVQLTAASRTVSLPGSPTQGMIYIVPASAGSNPNKIAIYDNAAWVYLAPKTGSRAFIADETKFYYWSGSAWTVETVDVPVDAIGEAPIDGATYSRKDGEWIVVSPTVAVEEAPIDGVAYERKNGDWVAAGSSFSLGGDLSGTTGAAVVTKLQGISVSTTDPVSGEVLKFNGTSWAPGADTSASSVTMTGDVTGSSSSNVVAALQGIPISTTDPVSGEVLKFDGSSWAPGTDTSGSGGISDAPSDGTKYVRKDAGWVSETAPVTSVTLAGDVTGASGANTVTKLQNRALAATAPSDGQVIAWDNSGSTWKPVTPSSGSAITVKDEGTNITTALTSLDFVGSGVAATNVSGAVTVTVSGGGSGTSTVSPTFKGARLRKSATQALAVASWTLLTWDLEDRDTNAFHDLVTNNSRITIPAGVTKVRLSAMIGTNVTSNNLHLEITKSGTTPGGVAWTSASNGNAAYRNAISDVIDVAAGDYFEAQAYLDGGTGSVNTTSWFALEVIEGTVLNQTVAASSGSYKGTFSATTGSITKTFDVGSIPSEFTWTNGTGSIVARADATAGTTSALIFADIGASQSTNFSFTAVATATTNALTVRYETSSETTYDLFRIMVDGVQVHSDSGSGLGFEQYSGTLTAGTHTITLSYTKDASADVGIDNIYISKIVYPNGDSGTPLYAVGDTVAYGGRYYYCTTTATTDVPGGGTGWAPFDLTAPFYDIPVYIPDKPTSSMICTRIVAVRAFTLPINLTSSVASAGTAATASTVLSVQKATTQIGTITFGAGSASGTFVAASPTSFVAGDILRIVAPSTADATLSDISVTLVGAR